MLVDWLDVARKQLDAIVQGRQGWSEESARALRAAIIERGEQIAEFPQSGRMIPEFQVEQLREVLEQGFRIMYEVFPDRIEVFGIVHSRQDVFGD